MAFRVTNEFVGQTTLSAASLDQNFTDIEAKFNQGITGQDLSPVAGITNQQLANSQYDFIISETIRVPTAAQPPFSPTVPAAVIALPGPDLVTGNWTIEESQYFLRRGDVAVEAISISATVGNIVGLAPGIFTGVAPVFGPVNIGTPLTGVAGLVLTQAANPVVPDQTQEPLWLGIFINSYSGGTIFSTIGDFLTLTFRMRRQGGLNQ